MRKNRLFYFAAAVTGVALCVATAYTNADDKPVANPPPEDFFKGVTHKFFGMGLAVDRAKAAETFAGKQLKKAFASGSSKQE